MSCKICNRSSCAAWMHSLEEQKSWSLLEDLDETQLKLKIISLQGEIEGLEKENSNLKEEIKSLERTICEKS